MSDPPLCLAYLAEPNAMAAREWMACLARTGHAVTLIARSETPIAPGMDDHIEIVRMRPIHGRIGGRLTALDARAALSAVLRKIHPDVLHVHDLTTGFHWTAWVSGFHPYVLTPWGSDLYSVLPASTSGRLFGRLALRDADLVTVNSQDLRRAAIQAGARPDRTETVQFGVDPDVYRPRPTDEAEVRAELALGDRRIVFSPRRLWPVYDHLAIVDAVAGLPDDVALVMTSWTASPDYLDAVTTRIHDLGITHRVRIVPGISRERMPAFYAAANVVVSVPHSDATAVTLLEAMASGRPLVVSNLPSPAEWVRQYSPESIVEVGDVAGIRAAIRAALETPGAELAQRGESGRRLVLEHADRGMNMTRMESLYRSLIRARSRG